MISLAEAGFLAIGDRPQRGPGHPERRHRFVHRSGRLDPGAVLADSGAAEQQPGVTWSPLRV